MAKESEGLIEQVPCEGPECQKPQAPDDRHGPGYANDVGPNWLRGMGKGQATDKPFFDKHRSGGK